jgi:hypothetical protein
MGGMALRLLLAVLAAVAVLSAACFGDDDDGPQASPTPAGAGSIATLTPAPERTATPRPVATQTQTPPATPTTGGDIGYTGFELFGDFTYASPAEFPENLMLLIETGCTQCDGPTEALYRVWRNEGETHVEKLIDASISDSDNVRITSYALTPDLAEIVVTVCTDCGGQGGPLLESPSTFYRSLDGGITWEMLLMVGPGEPALVRALTPAGIVVEGLDGALKYLEGDAIEPPAGTDGLWYESRRLGALVWEADGGSRLLDAAGATIAVVEPGARIGSVAFENVGGAPRPVASWREKGRAEPGWLITRMRADYSLAGFNSVEYVMPAVVLSDSSVLGLLTLPGNLIGGTVGYIDVERGMLTPIAGALIEEPFGDGQLPRGRNNLQAAVEGPFLRVTTTTPCADIRAGTTIDSELLTCASDGVLVHDLGESVTIGQQEWRHVRLLDGREGYAPAEVVTSD